MKKPKPVEARLLTGRRVVRILGLRGALGWINLFRGHKRNQRTIGGAHVVRILQCHYDKQDRKVVKLIVRLYGGPVQPNGGFNGAKMRLRDRREFSGSDCRGVLVVGGAVWSIDRFVRDWRSKVKRPLLPNPQRAEFTQTSTGPLAGSHLENDMMSTTPPPGVAFVEDPFPPSSRPRQATCFTGMPPLDDENHAELAGLSALLARCPTLLRVVSANGEPFWRLKCPDGAVLETTGYGNSETEGEVLAVWQRITGYCGPAKSVTEDAPAGRRGTNIPWTKVQASVALLLARHNGGCHHDLKPTESLPVAPPVTPKPRKAKLPETTPAVAPVLATSPATPPPRKAKTKTPAAVSPNVSDFLDDLFGG